LFFGDNLTESCGFATWYQCCRAVGQGDTTAWLAERLIAPYGRGNYAETVKYLNRVKLEASMLIRLISSWDIMLVVNCLARGSIGLVLSIKSAKYVPHCRHNAVAPMDNTQWLNPTIDTSRWSRQVHNWSKREFSGG